MTQDEMKALQAKLDAKRLERDIAKARKLGMLSAAQDKEDAFLRRLSYRNSLSRDS